MDTVLALSSRLADMKEVTLERLPSTAEIIITTKPFLLENLIWDCLDFAMVMTGSGKQVVVEVKRKADKACISLSGLQDLKANRETVFPGDQEKPLLYILQGEINVDAEHGKVEIALPDNVV